MKRIFIFLSCLVLAFGAVRQAHAHILLTDGSIGVVLHIEPDDEPVAGQRVVVFLEFKDKTGQFTPAQCNCRVRVLRDGVEVSQQPLVSAGSSSSEMSAAVLFPQRAAYQLLMSGSPLKTDAFQSFEMRYDLHVDQTATDQGASTNRALFKNPHALHALVVFTAFLLVAGNELQKRYRQYTHGKANHVVRPKS